MPDAPSKQLDVLVSGLMICAAARMLRIGYVRGIELGSFSLWRVVFVIALYLGAFALLTAAIASLDATWRVSLTTYWDRLAKSVPNGLRSDRAEKSVRYSALAATATMLARAMYLRWGHDLPGTDGMLFARYSADLALAGVNPYAVSMSPAFDRYGLTYDQATFRLDGTLVDTLSYPALSVIAFLPQAAARLPNLNLTTLIFLAVSLFVIAYEARGFAVWLLPLMLSANSDLINFSGGGVFDAIWMLPIALAMLAARRGRVVVSGLLFGCACSAKQTPWLLAPFVFMFFVLEHERLAAGLKAGARFAFASFASFALINLPFIIADAGAWLRGSLTPVMGGAPLVELGTGAVLLNLVGITALPKSFFSVAGLIVLGGSLTIYVAFYARLRWLAWVAALLALWCNYRSLQNYFVFSLPLAFYAVLLHISEPRQTARSRPRMALAAASLSVLAILCLAWVSNGRINLDGVLRVVDTEDPLHLGASEIVTIDATNGSNEIIRPAFAALHAKHLAPVIWTIVEGPDELQARGTARYRIRAPAGRGGLIPFDDAVQFRMYQRGTEQRILLNIDAFRRFDPAPSTHVVRNPTFARWSTENRRSLPYAWHDASINGRLGFDARITRDTAGLALEALNDAGRGGATLRLAALQQALESKPNELLVDASLAEVAPCHGDTQPLRAAGIELRGQHLRTRFVFSDCTERVVRNNVDSDVLVYVPAQVGRSTYRITLGDFEPPADAKPSLVLFAGVRPGDEPNRSRIVFHSVSTLQRQ